MWRKGNAAQGPTHKHNAFAHVSILLVCLFVWGRGLSIVLLFLFFQSHPTMLRLFLRHMRTQINMRMTAQAGTHSAVWVTKGQLTHRSSVTLLQCSKGICATHHCTECYNRRVPPSVSTVQPFCGRTSSEHLNISILKSI